MYQWISVITYKLKTNKGECPPIDFSAGDFWGGMSRGKCHMPVYGVDLRSS